jgi:hypothetical protein
MFRGLVASLLLLSVGLQPGALLEAVFLLGALSE